MVSASQLDKIGKKLVNGTATSEDRQHLNEFRLGHLALMVECQDFLTSHGYEATRRLKNVDTIREKIEREHSRLSKIEDIGGVRVVVPHIVAQNQLQQVLTTSFKATRVRDRRAEPKHGYRALHVIVTKDSYACEIQIRTRRQHQWAETFEALADTYGRQIRYGHPPREELAGRFRADVIGLMQRVSVMAALFDTREHVGIICTHLGDEEATKLFADVLDGRTLNEYLKQNQQEAAALDELLADLRKLLVA